MQTREQALTDHAIVRTVLPELYQLLDEVAEASPQLPKDLRVRIGRMLPAGYRHSFTKPSHGPA